jgi:hypothetical protein
MLKVVGALTVLAGASAATVTPVQKVIQLLEGMHKQGLAEKQDEEVKFSAYSRWCADTNRVKSEAIAKEQALIEKLTADIIKAAADAAAANADIQELSEDISRWENDNKMARGIREKEAIDFAATNQDYAETLDALDRAISTLKKQNYDRQQASLLQESLALLQTSVKSHANVRFAGKALSKFLQAPTTGQGFEHSAANAPKRAGPSTSEEHANFYNAAPEANAYEFASGGIVEMMEQLKDKFADEKASLEREEVNAKHSFENLGQTLADNIENAKTVIGRRTAFMNERLQQKAEAEGEKAATEADLKADLQYKADQEGLCAAKQSAYDERQKLRGDELDAITQAVEILSSGDVSGAADKHLPAMLLQMKSAVQAKAYDPLVAAQQQVARLLSARADKYNSQLLSMLAMRVSADPFKKVKKMIREMISKLMQEATAETEHHGWCQAELGENKITRDTKSAAIDDLSATLEQLNAEIAKLTEEVADLSADVAELSKDRAEATDVREAEHAKNTATVADSKAAQDAVTNALAILSDFYAKAGQATALVQGVDNNLPSEDAPETFDEKYTGMQGESGGVLGMLEVIQSDFARLESETSAAEAQAVAEYKKFMNDSEVDKAVKETDIAHKQGLIAKKGSEAQETKKELKTTQEELDAAEAYYKKLTPSCVDTGMTYAERVAKREEEMQSLKEAMEILKGVETTTI